MKISTHSIYTYLVLRNKWRNVEPKNAVIIDRLIPSFLTGLRPLSKGRKTLPPPATVPQKIGPETGKKKRLGAIFFVPSIVHFTTRAVRIVSWKIIIITFIIDDNSITFLRIGHQTCRVKDIMTAIMTLSFSKGNGISIMSRGKINDHTEVATK